MAIFCRHLITTELLIAAVWRVASRKSADGGRQNPNSILVDVGDVYQGTEVSLRNKGELMIDLFNHLKYDAWVIGNHEFDWGMRAVY